MQPPLFTTVSSDWVAPDLSSLMPTSSRTAAVYRVGGHDVHADQRQDLTYRFASAADLVQFYGWHPHLGDCRVILPTLSDFDLLLTDPPYGIGEASGKTHGPRNQKTKEREYERLSWDNEPIPDWVLSMMLAKAKHQIIFGGNYYRLPPTSCVLVWDKDNSGDFADAELAWTNLKKAVRLKKWRWNGMLQENMSRKEIREHPTQKPVAIMEWALTHAPDDVTTVCDPFMGSGTTGVACANMGKAFIGIERESKYFEIACERRLLL